MLAVQLAHTTVKGVYKLRERRIGRRLRVEYD